MCEDCSLRYAHKRSPVLVSPLAQTILIVHLGLVAILVDFTDKYHEGNDKSLHRSVGVCQSAHCCPQMMRTETRCQPKHRLLFSE
jgi:hypothetical protein